jgi:hypothetical protein
MSANRFLVTVGLAGAAIFASSRFPVPDFRFPISDFRRMGLTLHFRLSLPASTPRDQITERLHQLQAAATRMPFDAVCPVTSTKAQEPLGDGVGVPPLSYLFRFGASLQLPSFEPPPTSEGMDDPLPDAVGFSVLVGAGCEPAIFGLAFLPPRDDEWRLLTDQPRVWYWDCSCKTQYASNESDEHFIKCHTSLVALLDEAVKLGFIVEVTDEGGYWESRDVDRLLAALATMNRIVAKLGGALHDAIGTEHSIEAPIFEHPNFERLEMETDAPAQE